jgi:hypothetical protein
MKCLFRSPDWKGGVFRVPSGYFQGGGWEFGYNRGKMPEAYEVARCIFPTTILPRRGGFGMLAKVTDGYSGETGIKSIIPTSPAFACLIP